MPVTPVVVGFNDASATNIDLSLGSVNVQTAFTMACLFKRAAGWTSYDGLVIVASSGNATVTSLEVTGGGFLAIGTDDNNFASGDLPALVDDEWYIGIGGKAAGSSDPTLSLYRFSNLTWDHGTHGTARADTARTGAKVRLGTWATDTDRLKGYIAAAAIWGSNLSDVNRETLATDLNAWTALSPQAMWVGNGATSIIDEIGTANETARGAGVSAAGAQTSPLTWSGGGVTSATVDLDTGNVVAAGTAAVVAPPRPRPAHPYSEINLRM